LALDLTTPALLFPAISLLLLAYTNRFLSIAALIRALYKQYKDSQLEPLAEQIRNLRQRVVWILWMQGSGVASLLMCVLSMLALFEMWQNLGVWFFVGSLILMVSSLVFSLIELRISMRALDIQLNEMEVPVKFQTPNKE
jgi:hypothetical protein